MPEIIEKKKIANNYYHLKVRIIQSLNHYVREFCYLDSMPDKNESDIARMNLLRELITELLTLLRINFTPST